MTFAKGRQERESYKSKCLAIDLSLRCERRVFGSLKGYVVIQNKVGIASAKSSEDAWQVAYGFLTKRAADAKNPRR